jgi:hypothetical protein
LNITRQSTTTPVERVGVAPHKLQSRLAICPEPQLTLFLTHGLSACIPSVGFLLLVSGAEEFLGLDDISNACHYVDVLLLMRVYAGFPLTINGLLTAKKYLQAAPRNGIVDIAGPERPPFNEVVAAI